MNSDLRFGNLFPRGAVNVLVLVVMAAGYLAACGGGSGASNTAPVANAGPDQNVMTGTSVTLDGSVSTDPNGDLLNHSWLLMSKPSGSAATLSSTTAVRPTFTADRDGAYVARLVVNDGHEDSQADTVTITALAPYGIWGPAVTIHSGTGDAIWPNLAMDASGTAVVVWIQENGVWSSRYVPEIGWGAATPISAGTVRADTALVAMDGSGNAMAVWRQRDGNESSIYGNHYLPGTGWSAATPISAGTVRADTPHVAMDGSGNAIAVWRQWDGTDSNIYANRYVPGAGWGVETLIETGVDEADQPKVSINRNGTAITVWRYWKGSTSNSQWSASVYANRYEPGTGWGIETRIDAALGNATNPVAAIDSAGNILTVWNQADADIPPRQSIATRSYESGTGWGGVTNLAEVGYGGYVAVNEATTGDMGFAVVWTQGTTADAYGMSLPSTMEFVVSIYVPGTGWTSPANLGTAGWITDSANVAMGHDGNGVGVWSRQNLRLEGYIVSSSYTIYANRYVSGAGWGAPFVVATADGEVSPPQVVTDGNGSFTIVWGQRSGAKSTIFAVRYQQP